MFPETLGDYGIRCGRGIFQYLKAAAEPASEPDAEGKSVPLWIPAAPPQCGKAGCQAACKTLG